MKLFFITIAVLAFFFIILDAIYSSLKKIGKEQEKIRKLIETNQKDELTNRLSVFGNVEYENYSSIGRLPEYKVEILDEKTKNNLIDVSIKQIQESNEFLLKIRHRFDSDMYGTVLFNDLLQTLSKNGYEVTLDTSCDYFVTLGVKTKNACYKEELFIKLTSICSLLEAFYQEDNSEESQNQTEDFISSLVVIPNLNDSIEEAPHEM